MKSHGKGWVKKVFPGANTPEGFFSFYEQLLPPDANKTIIVKGGPGVGKSTFMKRVGQRFVDMGYDVEFFCCSSDNDSYDGAAVHDLGFTIVDGTAPHVVDPKNPGAVDEIINLGEFWNESSLRASRREIMNANAEISRLFERAFRYLKEAKIVHDDWEACYTEALDFGYVNCMADEMKRDILGDLPVTRVPGQPRRLFASALSPDGPVHHLDTIVGRLPRRYVLKGEPGTGKSTIARKIGEAAIERGLDVEFYHCPLDPTKVDHVVIPALGVAVISGTWPHLFDASKELDRTVEMKVALDRGVLSKCQDIIASSRERFHQAIVRATEFLHKAKTVHDEMQAYYVRSMDFGAVDRLSERVIARLIELEREAGAEVTA